MSRFDTIANGAHRSAGQALGLALQADGAESWATLTELWQVRLTEVERAALAWAALRSLTEDQAEEVCFAAFPGSGMPGAPVLGASVMEEAAFWAARASGTEREAYMLACYQAIPQARQSAFLAHVQGRNAA